MRRAFLEEVEAVYTERLDAFCSVVAAITGDRGVARDIVHEAFAAAIRSRDSFRSEGDLAAWVWRIVVNTARDHQRRSGRKPTTLEEGGIAAEHDFAAAQDASPEIVEAIQELPERQRLAVFLRYYADLDYRQIGEVLGMATGTVSATLSAAHRNLQQQLREVPR